MGIAISRYTDMASSDMLARFCSAEVICPNDPFWNQLLAFNINPPSNSEEQLMFDSSVESLLQLFLQNNLQSGNLGSLLQVFITRATELLAQPNTDKKHKLFAVPYCRTVAHAQSPIPRSLTALNALLDSSVDPECDVLAGEWKVVLNECLAYAERRPSSRVMLAWQTFNALFVIKAVTKYLVEMVPEYEVCRHLDVQAERRVPSDDQPSEAVSSSGTPVHSSPKLVGGESRVEMLIDALIGLIIDVPVTDNTYYLHLECINTILVLMSVYMFSGVHGQTMHVETSLIYRSLFCGRYSMHAPLLVKTLLANLSAMLPAPPTMFGAGVAGGSLLINLASGFWNMITLSATTRRTIYNNPPLDRHELLDRLRKDHPVANQSCLLLLALANHCMNDDNLYRNALLCCENTAEASSTTPQREGSTPGSQISPPRIDIAALHNALCATAGCEHSTLLLYLMLHSCKAYKRHVTNVPHIENMIVPILQVLYNAPENTSHHIYMSLIVLLILTEDDALIRNVHVIMLKNLSWYTERSISEISLGGLMVLVIVRALQYNMARVRDKYLHTNCLAAIANMSCEFRNLHPYVAQRLISLFESLTKRRTKLCSEIEGGDINSIELPHHAEEKTEEIMDHISVLDEVLRMMLEIINSCLSHQLVNNLNVVYALLHKRQLFTAHHSHPITQNIEMVIGYFSTRLQRVQDGVGGDLGVTEVLQCIKKGAEQWSSDRLKKFPDLKFRYVEEERPEEFFTPYVWSQISSCGGVYWASEGGARAVGDLLAC